MVIDLRNNGVVIFLWEHFSLLSEPYDGINWKTGIYVLIDKVTFRQQQVMLHNLDNPNAKIVGEPSSSNPTGYQDMGQFTLPNSGMMITYSKTFRFQDKVTKGVQPDVLIEYD